MPEPTAPGEEPKRRPPQGPPPDRFFVDDASAVRFGKAEGEPLPADEERGADEPLTESEWRGIVGE